DLLAQEVLHVGDLLGVVLLRVGVGDLDVREVLGAFGHVGVHRNTPRLSQVALREADDVLGRLLAAASGCNQDRGHQEKGVGAALAAAPYEATDAADAGSWGGGGGAPPLSARTIHLD